MNYLRFSVLAAIVFFELSIVFFFLENNIFQLIFTISICIQFAFVYESYLGLMEIKKGKFKELNKTGGFEDGRKIKIS